MYRLALSLPFQVTLVYGQVFETEEDARRQAARLPGGFQVLPESEIDQKAPTWYLPLREGNTRMKTEDIRSYLDKTRNPFAEGETVYIPDLNCYGTVSVVDGKTVIVRYGDGLSATFPMSSLQRVQ